MRSLHWLICRITSSNTSLGIKLHKPFCHRPSSGLSCPSNGHSGTKRWASTDQALGTCCPCGEHRVPKRLAIFWALLVRSAVLLLRMPHDVFAMLWWRFLWYFYHIYDTSMILLITQFKMYHSSILLHISYLFLYSVEKMILWYFFHKK